MSDVGETIFETSSYRISLIHLPSIYLILPFSLLSSMCILIYDMCLYVHSNLVYVSNKFF